MCVSVLRASSVKVFNCASRALISNLLNPAGRLVVEYLLEAYGVSSFKWAIAGRSQAKLEAVKRELAAKFPDAAVRRAFV